MIILNWLKFQTIYRKTVSSTSVLYVCATHNGKIGKTVRLNRPSHFIIIQSVVFSSFFLNMSRFKCKPLLPKKLRGIRLLSLDCTQYHALVKSI